MKQRKKPFTSTRKVMATILIGIILTGCAGKRPMALRSFKGESDLNDTSIGLFTLRTTNEYKPSFQPAVKWVEIVPSDSGKGKKFKVEKPYRSVKKQFYEYLISVNLKPGTYYVGMVMGRSKKVLISAFFEFDVGARFDIPQSSVVYLGHVDMINRKRKEGEPRSGSVIPLLDQAVAGYSGGTFDVVITDRRDNDIPVFLQKYPFLKGVSIETKIMQQKLL